MSADRARALLEASGYEVRFQVHEWVECLIAGHGEAWVGHGINRDDALAAALRHACPTALSVRLLLHAISSAAELEPARWPPWPADAEGAELEASAREREPDATPAAVAASGANGSTAAVAHAAHGAHDQIAEVHPAEAAAQDEHEDHDLTADSASLAANLSGSGPKLVSRGATELPSVMVRAQAVGGPVGIASIPPPIELKTPGQIATIISRPTTPRPPSGTFGLPLPDPRPAYEPPPVANPEEALEELDILAERIRDSREELGLCAPDRQRLAMLAWICLARSHTDGFPEDVRIRDKVSAISRQLTEVGKTFWPGSVTALQLHMQPRDLPRHLLGGVATTWRRAAELAEQALRNKEHEDERRGYDVHGWADRKMTLPRPAQAQRLLDQLLAEVEQMSGALELQAAPADASVRPDGPTFQRWVRTLRWQRCADIDPEKWARICGRFRWWAFRRDVQLAQAARELEPSYCPPLPWAALLGQDPEKRRHVQKLREVLAEAPKINGDPRQAVIDWLGQALPFGDTHHGNIVHFMQPYAEVVLGLKAEDIPGADRRVRRRFARLQEDIEAKKNDLKIAAVPEIGEEGTTGDLPEEGSIDIEAEDDHSLPADLVDRVRRYTKGKRSVFVGHRRDPELQASLREAFGFEVLDCRIAEPRRVEQLGEAIGDGRYDMVLGATGFQSHSLDKSLARACRQAGIHYIRVNQGEPIACLRAVARDFTR